MTNDDLPRVNQMKVNKDSSIPDLINAMRGTGFNAKRLALACGIYKDMIEDETCKKIFTLAGAMVPAGMRAIISDFIKHGYIDILVTTGANLTHDIIESLGCHHLQGSEGANDKELHEKQTNRIYDVYMPNESYENMEDFVKTLEFDRNMPLVDFLDFLGKEMGRLNPENTRDSILRAAHMHGVPIFCPAFTDCGLGVQLLLNNPGLNLDLFHDLDRMISLAWEMKNPGVFIIGGGVPKNFTFQALQFSPNNATYAIQITTDRPEPGGLSGATLSEAISWGKVNPKAPYVSVMCDATIALPFILSFLKDTVSTQRVG
ncbi:MAG: deoxyhypusine synthase family protein [Promethearchaeota archaeon]